MPGSRYCEAESTNIDLLFPSDMLGKAVTKDQQLLYGGYRRSRQAFQHHGSGCRLAGYVVRYAGYAQPGLTESDQISPFSVKQLATVNLGVAAFGTDNVIGMLKDGQEYMWTLAAGYVPF